MNTLLISLGDGVMMGRIEWPIDGVVLAIALTTAFVLLLAGLLSESTPTEIRVAGKSTTVPSLPRPLRHLPAV